MKPDHRPFCLAILLSHGLAAQCALQFEPPTNVAGSLPVFVSALANMPNGDLVIGGQFDTVAGTAAQNIARRSGSTWSPLGSGINGQVRSLAVLPNGDLIAGGVFPTAGGIAAANIARWNGTTWAPLGSGLTGSQVSFLFGVASLLVRPNGDLIAGGHFLNAGGAAVSNIAAWNGTSWSALGGGIPGGVTPSSALPQVLGLANLPGGDLVATGGALSVQRWDGQTWSGLGAGMAVSGFSVGPRALLVRRNGDLLAAGSDLVPLSQFRAPFVRRWTGSNWVAFGPSLLGLPGVTGTALALAELPNGDVVVGGEAMTGPAGGASNQLLRGDSLAWTSIANVGRPRSLVMSANGRLAIGGDAVGGPGAFAELASTCDAATTNIGSACAGSLGLHALTPTTLPWLGGTFRAQTSAVPPSSLVLAITSLSPATVPLSRVLPVAGPGCDGLVAAALSELVVPSGTTAASQIALPPVPSLAGAVLYHYAAVIEFNAGNAIALTSTQRLQLTLGFF